MEHEKYISYGNKENITIIRDDFVHPTKEMAG
jgi:hypothetical protein